RRCRGDRRRVAAGTWSPAGNHLRRRALAVCLQPSLLRRRIADRAGSRRNGWAIGRLHLPPWRPVARAVLHCGSPDRHASLADRLHQATGRPAPRHVGVQSALPVGRRPRRLPARGNRSLAEATHTCRSQRESCDLNPITIGPYYCGRGQSLLVIAGPCVIETEELTLSIAACLKQISAELSLP